MKDKILEAYEEILDESGARSYHLFLLQVGSQLDDIEDQMRGMGGELNIAIDQGLYKSNPVTTQMKKIADEISKLKEDVAMAAKNAKKLK